ncbi:hypothetical protein IW141_005911, partial [Coemansia sp. RSA 355]
AAATATIIAVAAMNVMVMETVAKETVMAVTATIIAAAAMTVTVMETGKRNGYSNGSNDYGGDDDGSDDYNGSDDYDSDGYGGNRSCNRTLVQGKCKAVGANPTLIANAAATQSMSFEHLHWLLGHVEIQRSESDHCSDM